MPMSSRKITLLVIAALIALVTVFAARSAMKPAPVKKAAVAVEQPQVEILIAKKALPAGSFVAPGDLEWKKWPAATPHEGIVTKDGDTDFNGAVVRTGLQAGEPVTVGRLLKTGDRGFLSAVLNAGMRAMTIKITPSSGVAGFIFPNDYVDVILTNEIRTGDGESGGKRLLSQTVLENVRVLALDQKTSDQDKQAKVAELATLEVSPKQAEKLALVGEIGNLSMVLRSIANGTPPVKEQAKDENGGIDPKLIEAVQKALPAPMPGTEKRERDFTWDSEVSEALPPPPDTREAIKVRIYRGSEATDMSFSRDN